ncbi:MAG TPA: GAF domain-containing sensor histidine kinase [Anaerolineales bacterium]|nr:GAF domain-containing sensor histidine kinase [Anaerolineales bacterium]
MLLTREQLQERLIALHQASLELVQEVSLEHLLELIVRTACEQVGARYAALGVLDDSGGLSKFITVGLTSQEIDRIGHPPVGKGLIRELMDTRAPIRLPEILADPRSVGFPRNHPTMVSFLGVPIRSADRQLGQIYLTDKIEGAEFSADDERIIQMLAGYAAAAIQNARLLEQMQARDEALIRRNQDLALLNDVAGVLTSSLESEEILNRTLATIMSYMKVEAGAIFLLEDDNQTLRMVLHRGQAAEAFWSRSRFRITEGTVGEVARTGRSRVNANPLSDQSSLLAAVAKLGFRQVAHLPLKSGDAVLGVMSVATRSAEPIEEGGLQLLEAVGNWAGLALENARLHQNARRLAILEERNRIGMDLHDGIIQSVYGVGLALENATQIVDEDPARAKALVKDSIQGLNQAIRDIRVYILDLRPRQLGNEGLLAGLKRLATEYRANTFSEIDLAGPDSGLDQIPQVSALALFHICQEALGNAAKHAGARHVIVRVWLTEERVLMEIQDDGKGFSIGTIGSSIGHGLSNMHTRARAVGGDVEITSNPGEGTTVLAWVPRLIAA